MNNKRHQTPTRYSWVAILVALLALSGCTITLPPPGTPIATPSNASDPLANTSWQLTSFGATDAETPVVADSTVTLAFSADGQAGGNAGCNTYGGSYQVQGDSLSFGELTRTLVACADEAIMQQEEQYMQALQSASRFDMTADHLTIWYDEGGSQLNFAPLAASASEPPSAGAPPVGGGDQMAERVEFEPGATMVTLSGTLVAGGEMHYALAASAGQTVTVAAVGEAAPVNFTVYGPSGTTWSGEAQADADNRVATQFTAPETGDYLVTLTAPADGTETAYEVTFTVDPSAVTRIGFPAGETTVERSGALPAGAASRQFLLSGNAGWTLTVDATSDAVPLSMTIEDPAGFAMIPEMREIEGGYAIGAQYPLPEPGYYLVTLNKADQTPSTTYTVTFTLDDGS